MSDWTLWQWCWVAFCVYTVAGDEVDGHGLTGCPWTTSFLLFVLTQILGIIT